MTLLKQGSMSVKSSIFLSLLSLSMTAVDTDNVQQQWSWLLLRKKCHCVTQWCCLLSCLVSATSPDSVCRTLVTLNLHVLSCCSDVVVGSNSCTSDSEQLESDRRGGGTCEYWPLRDALVTKHADTGLIWQGTRQDEDLSGGVDAGDVGEWYSEQQESSQSEERFSESARHQHPGQERPGWDAGITDAQHLLQQTQVQIPLLSWRRQGNSFDSITSGFRYWPLSFLTTVDLCIFSESMNQNCWSRVNFYMDMEIKSCTNTQSSSL